MTHVEQPLGLLFSYFPTESLRQLAQALQENRVISRTYQDARGNGCLLWQLDHNIDSRDMRIRTFGFDPQLLKASMPRLCQQCHVESRHPTTPALSTTRVAINRGCTNCHSQIHGSNHPGGVYYQR